MSLFARLLFTIQISIFSLILMACGPIDRKIDKKSHSQTNISAQEPHADKNPQTLIEPHLGDRGTGDSGGGNGAQGRVYESYIVNPIQLPAFKKHLKERFDKINWDVPSYGIERFEDLLLLMNTKTWYIAPVKLNAIDKEVLGVHFLKSESQQIAIQTKNEVWIDQAIYNEMTSKQQADLIIHEMLMTLYFLQFLSMSEICQMTHINDSETEYRDCDALRENIERAFPKEDFRELNSSDYENIRRATKHFYELTDSAVNNSSFLRMLFDNGFDSRWFGPEKHNILNENDETTEISSENYKKIMEKAKLSGYVPDQCYLSDSNILENCNLKLTLSTGNYFGYNLQGYQFQVEIEEHGVIDFWIPLTDESILDSSGPTSNGVFLIHNFITFDNAVEVGSNGYFGFIFFRKISNSEKVELKFDSIILHPIVATQMSSDGHPCEIAFLKPENSLREKIVLLQGRSEPSALERIYLGSEITYSCQEGTSQE